MILSGNNNRWPTLQWSDSKATSSGLGTDDLRSRGQFNDKNLRSLVGITKERISSFRDTNLWRAASLSDCRAAWKLFEPNNFSWWDSSWASRSVEASSKQGESSFWWVRRSQKFWTTDPQEGASTRGNGKAASSVSREDASEKTAGESCNEGSVIKWWRTVSMVAEQGDGNDKKNLIRFQSRNVLIRNNISRLSSLSSSGKNRLRRHIDNRGNNI